jgi:hypothetical protein
MRSIYCDGLCQPSIAVFCDPAGQNMIWSSFVGVKNVIIAEVLIYFTKVDLKKIFWQTRGGWLAM